MASCTFPHNRLLLAMSYVGTELTLTLNKGKRIETRVYADVPQNVAYTLLYKRTGSDVLSYYAKHIKKHFKVLVK